MQNHGRADNPKATLGRVKHSTPRRIHRGVLAALAGFALVVWVTGAPDGSGEVDRGFGIAALALAAASIIARRAAPATRLRPGYLVPLLASPLLAAGVGLVGVVLAVGGGPRQVALLYVLGGAILALRPPPPIDMRP
jgi:hypothetical protein